MEQFAALIVLVRDVHMPRGPQDLGGDWQTEYSIERREKNFVVGSFFFPTLRKN